MANIITIVDTSNIHCKLIAV